jgi:competence protein ComEA
MLRLLWICALWLMLALPAWAGININTASADELKSLPGIGDTKAAAIIAHRSSNGPFQSVDQLGDVTGIGPKTLEALRGLIEVGDGATVSAGAPPPTDGGSKAPSGPAVDINTASAAELDALPGIGPSKAAAIVADREANGRFSSCDDLTRVQGIGPATVTNMAGMCVAR